MLFRRVQNIVTKSHLVRRLVHNHGNRQHSLAKYQFTYDEFWSSRNLVKPISQFKQTIKGREIRKKEIKDTMEKGPFGIFDHVLQNRDSPFGQDESDMETIKTCIDWFFNHPELFTTGNAHHYDFRKTPGFFTKIDIWKGKKIQVLVHIFEENKPQHGVIHNHNHGFYFQNISLQQDAEYKTSQYIVSEDENEKCYVYQWSRDARSGKLEPIDSQRGALLKTYEHDYKNGNIGFIEQNTFHQVSKSKGQVVSLIVRDASYHGDQKIISQNPTLPEDQEFKVVEPDLDFKKSLMQTLRKAKKNYAES